LGNPPVFISVTGLLDHLRSTFAPSSTVRFDRLFEEVRTGSLLILDDLNTQNMTSWSREKLYQIFDYRYYTELPTIITTSEEIERIDAKLRSRLLDTRLCSIIAIMAPSYTGAVRKVATRINKTKLTGR
jgi:DNA replication protein DnaC